MTDRTPFRK